MRLLATAIAAGLLATGLPAGPAAASDTEQQLRDALRAATLQQRVLEDERAGLNARLAQYEAMIEALQAQLSGQVDPTALSSLESDFNQRLAGKNETIGKLGDRLEQLRDTIAQLTDNRDKWKAAYEEAADVARAKEAARAELAGHNTTLSEQVSDCRARNMALFEVGSEILDRYADMDLGDALAAREPFIGFKRVELQNLVQEYLDKLLDQQVTP